MSIFVDEKKALFDWTNRITQSIKLDSDKPCQDNSPYSGANSCLKYSLHNRSQMQRQLCDNYKNLKKFDHALKSVSTKCPYPQFELMIYLVIDKRWRKRIKKKWVKCQLMLFKQKFWFLFIYKRKIKESITMVVQKIQCFRRIFELYTSLFIHLIDWLIEYGFTRYR